DALDGDGEERPVYRLDALRLAAAEPEAALSVEVAQVAHAVPQAALRVADLVQGRLVRAAVVGARHDRPLHDDLPDLALRHFQAVAPLRERSVADADDADVHTLHGPADADALALGGQRGRLAEELVAADVGDGQGLGGAVGRVDLDA